MRTLVGIAFAAAVVCGHAHAPAQQDTMRQEAPCDADRETIDCLVQSLSHGYTAKASDGQPQLHLYVTPIRVEGLPDTMLVQLARADSPLQPFRMYVMQLYGLRGVLHARTFELPGGAELKDAFAGLWGAPESLALIDGALLAPSLDMPIIRKPRVGRADSLSAKTEHPFPINRDGAVEMTGEIRFMGPVLELSDAGFDAAGKQVWGTNDPLHFVWQDAPPAIVRGPEGLVSITTISAPADAPRLRSATEGGGEIAIHFTYWTSTGQRIDTSRKPGREPTKIRIPGGTPLPALDTALAGIAKGERRKIVVPAALAYGATGRGTVPPNATLIYDIECFGVDNTAAPSKPALVPGVSPHAPAPAPKAPSAPSDPVPGSEPSGSPPTNGNPETPR